MCFMCLFKIKQFLQEYDIVLVFLQIPTNYDESFRFLCTNIYCFCIPLFHNYLEFFPEAVFAIFYCSLMMVI